MTYEVKLSPEVDIFLNKCESQLCERIKNKLKALKENPFHFLEHYESDDFYKLRIGDYRALIEVDTSRKMVFVLHIDHRKRIYKYH